VLVTHHRLPQRLPLPPSRRVFFFFFTPVRAEAVPPALKDRTAHPFFYFALFFFSPLAVSVICFLSPGYASAILPRLDIRWLQVPHSLNFPLLFLPFSCDDFFGEWVRSHQRRPFPNFYVRSALFFFSTTIPRQIFRTFLLPFHSVPSSWGSPFHPPLGHAKRHGGDAFRQPVCSFFVTVYQGPNRVWTVGSGPFVFLATASAPFPAPPSDTDFRSPQEAGLISGRFSSGIFFFFPPASGFWTQVTPSPPRHPFRPPALTRLL